MGTEGGWAQDGHTVRLSEFCGKQEVALFFYMVAS